MTNKTLGAGAVVAALAFVLVATDARAIVDTCVSYAKAKTALYTRAPSRQVLERFADDECAHHGLTTVLGPQPPLPPRAGAAR